LLIDVPFAQGGDGTRAASADVVGTLSTALWPLADGVLKATSWARSFGSLTIRWPLLADLGRQLRNSVALVVGAACKGCRRELADANPEAPTRKD
jgi:hypothetical protein